MRRAELRSFGEHAGTFIGFSDSRIASQVPEDWNHPDCPNFSDWLPGDIFLVRSSGSTVHRAIEVAQRASRNRATRDGSAYVHAAIYVGQGKIVDMTPAHGIALRSVWEYCFGHTTSLRRHPDLTDADREEIVTVASKLIDQNLSYSWSEIVKSYVISGTVPHPERLYCSTLVGLVFDQACGIALHGPAMYRPLYPGTLAEHQQLDVVELEWQTVLQEYPT